LTTVCPAEAGFSIPNELTEKVALPALLKRTAVPVPEYPSDFPSEARDRLIALSPITEQALGTVPEALMILESVAAKPLSGRTAIMPKLAVIAVNRRRFMGIP
jgi:hypothetical protein